MNNSQVQKFIAGIVGAFLLSGCSPSSSGFSASPVDSLGNSIVQQQVPPRPSDAANLTTCAGAQTTTGMDISAYNPGTQWSAVQHGGLGFSFIKATEGTAYTNALFIADWPGARAVGLVRGAYHFFHPGQDPAQQATYFLKTLGALERDDLPAMLDWETTDGVSSAVQIQNAMIWLQKVESATGKTPIIYADPSFWNALGNPTQFARFPFFVAHYDVACPLIPPPWSNWVFWQHGAGPITGVQTSVADQDLFNGSLAQLRNFAITGAF